MRSKWFWRGLADRAVKSFAQTLLVTLVLYTNVFDVDWRAAVGTAALVALTSVLTSLASAPATGTPSLIKDRPSNEL